MKSTLSLDLKDHLRKNGNIWTEWVKDEIYNEYLSFPRVIYKVEGDEIFQLETKEIPEFILRDLIK